MTKYAIEVRNVKKSFFLPHSKNSSIKSAITQMFKPKEKGGETFNVLNGVSFKVEKGEFFGVLGRNGSGKSTLLKIISEIYQPTSGSVKHDGKIVSFIELGVGFKTELSGRENVFLNGALLGFSREEIAEMYDDIVEFAELEEFMDQKLKNYSSGMKVRLAFSVAIRARADILILDEVLAVGDEAFQRKCNDYFMSVKKDPSRTVILVTHSMASVQQFCDRAMLIEGGEIVDIGEPVDVAQQYSELFITTKTTNKDGVEEKRIARNDEFTVATDVKTDEERVDISFAITPLTDFADPVVGAYMSRSNGDIVWRWSSDDETPTNDEVDVNLKKNITSNIHIQLDNILPSDSFTVTLLIRKRDRSEEYAKYARIISFNNYNSSLYRKFWKINETVEVSNDA